MAKAGSERKTVFVRAVLFILAALLVFGGPTYFVYAMQKVNLPYLVSVFVGLIAFAGGILLFWRLARKQTKLDVT